MTLARPLPSAENGTMATSRAGCRPCWGSMAIKSQYGICIKVSDKHSLVSKLCLIQSNACRISVHQLLNNNLLSTPRFLSYPAWPALYKITKFIGFSWEATAGSNRMQKTEKLRGNRVSLFRMYMYASKTKLQFTTIQFQESYYWGLSRLSSGEEELRANSNSIFPRTGPMPLLWWKLKYQKAQNISRPSQGCAVVRRFFSK